MKKTISLIAFFFCFTICLANVNDDDSPNQGERIDFTVSYDEPIIGNKPHPKAPVRIPIVYKSGYTLDFRTYCPGYTLKIADFNGEIVYVAELPQGTKCYTLPSFLDGEYQIILETNPYAFIGAISF